MKPSIAHIGIAVTDVESALRFYRDILGVAVRGARAWACLCRALTRDFLPPNPRRLAKPIPAVASP